MGELVGRGGLIIVLQDEIFGGEKFRLHWFINKLLAPRTFCQATKQTLPHPGDERTAQEAAYWVSRLTTQLL